MNSIVYHKQLPAALDEPYYFLSSNQYEVIQQRMPSLRGYLDYLPVWIPHRLIAEALGFSDEGVRRGLEFTSGRPYVWATEFENVHSHWNFEEPEIEVQGVSYASVEAYYHSQKPTPFDNLQWESQRCHVMRQGLREKFKRPELASLLVSTGSHPLVSVKPDRFWGVDPKLGGENTLGVLMEEVRSGMAN